MIRWNKLPQSELWGKMALLYSLGCMMNTGELNANDKQEIEHKDHLR